MTEPNVVIYGRPRVGKTYYALLYEIIPWIEKGLALVLTDQHASLAELVIAYCLSRGHDDRLVIDDLGEYRHVASPGFFAPSQAVRAAERDAEDLATSRDFAEALVAPRGPEYGSLDGKVQVKEWTIAAMMAGLSQPAVFDWRDLEWSFRPGSTKFNAFVAGISRPTYQAKFASLARFNSEVALYNAVGPSARLLSEAWSEPAFRERLNATVDFEAFLLAGGIWVMTGGEDATGRTLNRLMRLRTINAVRRHYNRGR